MCDRDDMKFTSSLAQVLKLSLPASLGMLGRTVTQFIDGVMVARLGPAVLSAQFVGGMTAFVPESFSIGILGVVNTYVSQNLGAGRPRRTGQYAWAGLAMVAMFSVLFCPLAAMARPLFSLMGHASNVQPMEALYFRYMILAMPLTMSIRVLEAFFYGIHRPGVVVVVSLLANIVNVAGNYALIFGQFGFPAMGLEGAAIATVTSWALQLTILLGLFLSPWIHRQFFTRAVRSVRLRQCFDIFRIGWPAGTSFLVDLFTWSVFTTVLVGRFGTLHLAAATAAMRYMALSFMPTVGISIATTALVGKAIGAGRPDLARRYAHTAVLTAMVYMGTCGLAFFLLRHPMVSLFATTTEDFSYASGTDAARIIQIGGRIMICAAVFQLFDSMAIVFSGALRGAGDTFWPMCATIVLSLTVLVGGGIAMVEFAPQLESLGPYIAATAYIIAAGLVLAKRFESGAWRKIDLLGRRSSVPSGKDVAADESNPID